MTRKKDQVPDAQKALINQLIQESGGPQALFDKGGLLDQLKKRLIEQALEAEMDDLYSKAPYLTVFVKSSIRSMGFFP